MKREKVSKETTQEKRTQFIKLLCVYGNVSKAAEEAKIDRRNLYRHKESNEAFSLLWDEAYNIGIQALEDEARRRAFEGCLKPVYYQGQCCGEVREYSDTLLIFLLKGAMPEKYSERNRVDLGAEEALKKLDDILGKFDGNL